MLFSVWNFAVGIYPKIMKTQISGLKHVGLKKVILKKIYHHWKALEPLKLYLSYFQGQRIHSKFCENSRNDISDNKNFITLSTGWVKQPKLRNNCSQCWHKNRFDWTVIDQISVCLIFFEPTLSGFPTKGSDTGSKKLLLVDFSFTGRFGWQNIWIQRSSK